MTKAEVRVLDAEPACEGVTELLEEALGDAKAGKISSVGLVIVFRDGSSQPQWSDAANMVTLIGGASRLVHSLNKTLDGE